MTNIPPVIQGGGVTSDSVTQDEISKTVDFCFQAFKPAAREQREAVMKKVESISGPNGALSKEADEELQKALSPDELQILNTMRARQMVRQEDIVNIENFSSDAIDGMVPNLKTGSLTLVRAKVDGEVKRKKDNVLDMMKGEDQMGQEPIAAY